MGSECGARTALSWTRLSAAIIYEVNVSIYQACERPTFHCKRQVPITAGLPYPLYTLAHELKRFLQPPPAAHLPPQQEVVILARRKMDVGSMDWTSTAPATYSDDLTPVCTSPLGRLPGELRNRIYELLVPSGSTFEVTTDTAARTQPSVSKVCRQLRAETLPIYYAANIFILEIRGSDTSPALKWL